MLNKLKKLSVVHPFLFAIAPVLFLFAYNIWEVPAADLLLPIVVVIVGTLVLFFSLRLVTKSYNKSGIITSFFVILFFSYGHARELIYSLYEFDVPNTVGEQIGINIFLAFLWALLDILAQIGINNFLEFLWVLLFVTAAFLVIKSRSNFRGFTQFLNITAVTLIVISLINISVYEIRTINLEQDETITEGNSLDSSNSDNLPDIYYIILDMYARSDTLKEVYSYNNSEFTSYLANKGFYIASKSRSNYPETRQSLASSLNMGYVEDIQDTKGIKDPTLIKMMQNNRVSQLLKSKGYRYIFISNVFFEKGMSRYADVYRAVPRSGMSNFASCLIRSTALATITASLTRPDVRAKVLYSFDTLADMPDNKGLKFIFAHIACPHPPYVFDRNGDPVTPIGRQYTPEETKEKYLDQLIFISKKVETVVDEILSKSSITPIIILQGDTGPFASPNVGMAEEMNIKMNIFNAYFLPENGKHLLYESITPVNSFRIVFNLYFDTNYDLLEDKSYYFNGILVPPESNSD